MDRQHGVCAFATPKGDDCYQAVHEYEIFPSSWVRTTEISDNPYRIIGHFLKHSGECCWNPVTQIKRKRIPQSDLFSPTPWYRARNPEISVHPNCGSWCHSILLLLLYAEQNPSQHCALRELEPCTLFSSRHVPDTAWSCSMSFSLLPAYLSRIRNHASPWEHHCVVR